MAAGVHDGCQRAVIVLDGPGTHVREIRLFFYGEGVHVCAEKDGRALAVAEDAGDAVAADVSVDFII
jgi:hypothetical protein